MSTDIPTPNPPVRRRVGGDRPCPNGSTDPSEATVEAWHNFTGEGAEYRRSMGEHAGPPHARIQMEHSCGWSVALPATLLSWAYLTDVIQGHFGRLDAPAESVAAGSVVSTEGSGLPAMLRAAAEGRREYAKNAPESSRAVLEQESATLESAARLAEGDMSPMYGWLPSWRYSEVLSGSTEGSGHPQPAPARTDDWTLSTLPRLSLDTPEGDTDANH